MKTIARISVLFLITLPIFLACKTPIEPDPIANFTTNLRQNGLVEFTNNSTNFATTIWEYGDGETGYNTSNHTYQNNGTYQVTLNAKSGTGKIAKYTSNVTVNNVTGSLSFFLSFDAKGTLEVKLLNKTIVIAGWYKSGTPACGDQYTATFDNLPAGNYTYYIRGTGYTSYVAYNVTVSRGCKVVKI